MVDDALRAAVGRFAAAPQVLIACDFDGTIAELVDDPAHAVPNEQAIKAVRELGQLPRTHVAIVSGRSLHELAALTGLSGQARLIGSHGAEFDDDPVAGDEGRQVDLDHLVRETLEICGASSGARVERKALGAAVHTRGLRADAAAEISQQVIDRFEHRHGMFLRSGKDVIEVSLVSTTKDAAIGRLRASLPVTAICFIGDDTTDEDVFDVLNPVSDLGIKVGDGATAAMWRVSSVDAVGSVLTRLAQARAKSPN